MHFYNVYNIVYNITMCDNFCVNFVLANLVLHRTVERIHVGKKYGDIPRGIFVIRGENVVLLGEIVSASCQQIFFAS